jgi:catechol 2,3-dioxygenase-like lactoylglutathione lyase family enzyme
MIVFNRINHVQICIPPGAENDARSFYTDLIGLQEIPKPPSLTANGGLWYKIADVELHIGVEPVVARSKRHPAFEINDLAFARDLLEKNNIQIQEEPYIEGRIRFSFIDPFGNRIELLQIIAT